MKKIDLHVHTIATVSDSAFTFSMDKLKEYVKARSIDCIAITNHNIFDKTQYDSIRKELDILVLPGIEVNLEKGHIILITEENDIVDFSAKCNQVKSKIKTANDYLSFSEFDLIFKDRKKYLVIPHYKKTPYIRQEVIDKVGDIFCGEVKNQRQFSICTKDPNSLNPVLFSDIRIKEDLVDFPIRQTFINTNEVTFSSIVYSLRDKNKLSLSADGKDGLFEIMPNGFVASTGLNVVLGNRSSGKTVTLDNIFKYNSNVKYIRQFELIEKDEKKEEIIFTNKIKTNRSDLIDSYLFEFKNVINDISKIDLDKDNADLSEYIESWIKYANEFDKRDSFSKSRIYSDNSLDLKQTDEAEKIIKAVLTLLSAVEYKNVISKY